MEITRCMNCMEELQENNTICPVCGVDNRNIEQPNYALRCGAMLHGRYLMGRVLGQGGFGITYIGMDMLLNIKVAVKEYFPMGMVTRDSGGSSKILWNMSQASQSQRQSGYDSFLKEARKMAKIDEIPSIVRVRDLFLENETAYIVMDFVEGITLKQKLQQEGPMPFSECLALLRPMMADLAKVHKQGMIHRDISPDNIMIRKDGKVRLLDLGAAKDMTTAHGVSSQVVAKKGFSPFEQYMDTGNIGTWTDVYALCATIYYCITGKLLPEALKRMEEEEEISFPDSLKEPLPQEVKEAMRAGLEVRAKKRTQNVEELLRKLDAGNLGEETAKEPQKEAVGTVEEPRQEKKEAVKEPRQGAEEVIKESQQGQKEVEEKESKSVKSASEWTPKEKGVVEFEVRLREKDITDFIKHQRSSVAPLALIGLIFVLYGIWMLDSGAGVGLVLWVFGGVCIVPLFIAGMGTRNQIISSDMFKNAFYYQIDDVGVHITQGEQTTDLQWKQILNMFFTKNQILIYFKGYPYIIIPKEAVGEQYQAILDLATSHLERRRLKRSR